MSVTNDYWIQGRLPYAEATRLRAAMPDGVARLHDVDTEERLAEWHGAKPREIPDSTPVTFTIGFFRGMDSLAEALADEVYRCWGPALLPFTLNGVEYGLVVRDDEADPDDDVVHEWPLWADRHPTVGPDEVLVQDLATGEVTAEPALWLYDLRTQTGRGVEQRERVSLGDATEFLAARFPVDALDSIMFTLAKDGEVATTVVGWGDVWVERYLETVQPHGYLHPERPTPEPRRVPRGITSPGKDPA